jgi:hypothetical protein
MLRAPSFDAVRWLKIADNSTNYSLGSTTMQSLWLPTSREVKYKAKQAVDLVLRACRRRPLGGGRLLGRAHQPEHHRIRGAEHRVRVRLAGGRGRVAAATAGPGRPFDAGPALIAGERRRMPVRDGVGDAYLPGQRARRLLPDHPLSSTVRVEFGARSIRGGSHDINEDHYLIVQLMRQQDTIETSLPATHERRFEEYGYAMVVADGVGETGTGEVASRIAVETLSSLAVHFGKWNLRVDDQDRAGNHGPRRAVSTGTSTAP